VQTVAHLPCVDPNHTQIKGATPMTVTFEPTPEDHFTFGLWTVGNPGRDPFGHETRPPLDPVEAVHRLADLGAYGVSFHDNDLVPWGSSPSEREAIVKRFRQALDATGVKVPMATTNLFSRPLFKEGAFTANDPAVRRMAVAKTLDAIDLGAELGANTFVLWGGREGVEADAAKDVAGALDRYAEAVNLLCAYARERSYDLRFALEPKPNEPRGDILLPTVGHALAFINELEWPDMVGLNPEFAHETMSGLSFSHAIAQTLWHDKLFHIDLNAQRIGKFDQDFRFGSEGIRDAFYTVMVLEDAGWDGMRHFDAHPYRTEDPDGVWDFARGCIRTYLILREKVRRFHVDADIAQALEMARRRDITEPTSPDGLGPEALSALRSLASTYPEDTLATTGYGHERLDQLVTELLLGVR
jgi:xylose isomerase